MRNPTSNFRLLMGPADSGQRNGGFARVAAPKLFDSGTPEAANHPKWNMVVDEAILTAAIQERDDRPSLRLYGWDPPTLSVGVNAIVPGEVFDRCAGAGVDIVRRPTGGGAVLHDGDITYAVVARHGRMGVRETYAFVAEGLIASFATLGIRAEIAEHPTRRVSLACFAVPTGADIVAGAAKIVGSAQVRRAGWCLQHGSIPIRDTRPATAQLLGNDRPDASTFLRAFCPDITWQEAAQALIRGFTKIWGHPVEEGLSERQGRLVDELLAKT